MSSAFVGPLVGLELEYFLVDRVTLQPRDVYDGLSGLPGFGVHLKTEVGLEQLEIASPPAASVTELLAWLVPIHQAVEARLADLGARLFPVALLDTAPLGVRSDASTLALAAAFGPSLATYAPLVAADQVNVGADDEGDALRVLERLRRCLPELMALSVASPLRHGEATGKACNRLDVVRATAGPHQAIIGFPDPIPTLADYAARVQQLPILQRPGAYYKWVRPMPLRGVAAEVRCMDKQPTLSRSVAFAALCHGLAAHARVADPWTDGVDEEDLRTRFAAAEDHGQADRGRVDAMLDAAAGCLSPSDALLLDPLRAPAGSAGSAACRLAAATAEQGVDAAYAGVAADFDRDLAGLANAM